MIIAGVLERYAQSGCDYSHVTSETLISTGWHKVKLVIDSPRTMRVCLNISTFVYIFVNTFPFICSYVYVKCEERIMVEVSIKCEDSQKTEFLQSCHQRTRLLVLGLKNKEATAVLKGVVELTDGEKAPPH